MSKFFLLTYSVILSAVLVAASPAFAANAEDCLTDAYDHALKKLMDEPTTPPVLTPAEVAKQTEENKFIVDTLAPGAPDLLAADQLYRKLENPKDWERAIGASYRQIPKVNNQGSRGRIGGRRIADRLLTMIQRWDEKFAAVKATNPEAATQEYANAIKKQTALFHSKYDESDVATVIQVFKDYMKDYRSKSTGAPQSMTLGGSFVNGRADITTSDIDVSVSDRAMMQDMDGLKAKINSALHAKRPEAALTLEPHTEPAGFYGKINPFVIKVSQDNKVQLYIYGPSKPIYSGDLIPTEPIILDLH